MNLIFTYKFDDTKLATLEENLQLAFPDYENIEMGMEIGRVGKMELDPARIKKKHPYSNKIKENQQNYFLVNGSVRVTYEWIDEDGIQESDVDAFIRYLDDCPETWTTKKDIENKKLIIEYTYTGENKNFNTFPLSYMLDTSNLSIVALSDDSEILCIMQKNYQIVWNMAHIDLQPQEEIYVTKPICDVAYVIVSQDAVIETTLLGKTNKDHTVPISKFSVRKLESQSVKLKNVSDKPNKVIVYSK